MDTTTFYPTATKLLGPAYMDYITAGLLALVSVAMFALIGMYVCAGICKRVR